MHLSKLKRQQIRDRFGGRCAYCGNELGARWHADHIDPVWRTPPKGELHGRAVPTRMERDHFGNLMPACPPCNLSKSTYSLDQWRAVIQRYVTSLNAYHAPYRIAKSFGLIAESDRPIQFYFEQHEGASP